MWDDPSVQRNVAILKEQGVVFAGPGKGELACGTSGEGRLIELEIIFDMAVEILTAPGVLAGVKFLVTAGPTREYIDDVRFLSNPSTGKMGFAIAEEASKMGAEVVLIHGPVSIAPPKEVETVPVVSAEDMKRNVIAKAPDADIIVMSAAVADWTVEKQSGKIKKSGRDKLTLEMKPTTDILAKLGELFPNKLKVGFAVEVENIAENAREKMSRKKIDLIFANNPKIKGTAFGTDTNGGLLITHMETREIPILTKSEVARIIIAQAYRILEEKRIDS
ncbi:MAG TPA: bifunctional phosphopantothenoylcysteine decarboxylase/phosphopantothenate--cysteine ligase CoaBC, partial [candidate division Zixibacteria bacterium]|nr:bifunctional phosphopantothenoylcysteine decarboxylase/phosphopantothenate--cysteine ligase CoaBC [candidate division Zixibacteria bacterium]